MCRLAEACYHSLLRSCQRNSVNLFNIYTSASHPFDQMAFLHVERELWDFSDLYPSNCPRLSVRDELHCWLRWSSSLLASFCLHAADGAERAAHSSYSLSWRFAKRGHTVSIGLGGSLRAAESCREPDCGLLQREELRCALYWTAPRSHHVTSRQMLKLRYRRWKSAAYFH